MHAYLWIDHCPTLSSKFKGAMHCHPGAVTNVHRRTPIYLFPFEAVSSFYIGVLMSVLYTLLTLIKFISHGENQQEEQVRPADYPIHSGINRKAG